MTWQQFVATMLGLAALAAARALDRFLPGRDKIPPRPSEPPQPTSEG